MTSIANSSRRQSDPTLQPWSHRQPYAVRVLITIVSGVAAGVVGTLAHRMGAAQNIPYGLLLAFLILGGVAAVLVQLEARLRLKAGAS